MKKTFLCACGTHLLEIEYNNIVEYTNVKTKKKHKENTPELCVCIYDIYNPDTGRKYKKPKLISDVVFIGDENHGKELDFVMDFLSKIELAYLTRKK